MQGSLLIESPGVWVAYIKTQLRIATQVSVIKIKVTVTKNKNQFLLNNSSLLCPFDTKLGVWVAYFKTQLGIATQVIKVMVTVTKNRNSVVFATTQTWLYESVIAFGETLDWNYWRLIDLYVCVMSGTSIIIDLFHQSLFLITSGSITAGDLWFFNAQNAMFSYFFLRLRIILTASVFLHCHFSFLIPVTSILGWIVENLVVSHCGVSCFINKRKIYIYFGYCVLLFLLSTFSCKNTGFTKACVTWWKLFSWLLPLIQSCAPYFDVSHYPFYFGNSRKIHLFVSIWVIKALFYDEYF